MPATMGENCHNDRGGDREMKGSEKKVCVCEVREMWCGRETGQNKERARARGR